MKRLMFTILALPLIAGCWWSKDKKSDVVEETRLEKTEELLGAEEEMSEGMTPAASNLAASTEDDK